MPPAIPNKLYFKIGEVSKITGVEPYILRYWESEFKLVKPYRTKSNQRLYRKKDLEAILKIKKMLYDDKFTIEGAKKKLKKVATQDTQLPLNFSHQKYQETVQMLRDELSDIAGMLAKPL